MDFFLGIGLTIFFYVCIILVSSFIDFLISKYLKR